MPIFGQIFMAMENFTPDLGIRAELNRLWLLFLPTITAVGLLLTILSRDELVELFLEHFTYPNFSGEWHFLRPHAARWLPRWGHSVAFSMAR